MQVSSFPTSDVLAANAINLYDSGWSMNNVLFMVLSIQLISY